MTYTEALAQILQLSGELHARRKFDLVHMRTLMRAVGDPQQSLRSVLIAGTNGKGSTAATLGAIVAAAGYKVGLYTSPHLVRVNERIQLLRADPSDGLISQREISDEAFADCFAVVMRAAERLVKRGELPGEPSFFETVTAMAFRFFAMEGVDLAVLEVGMGGRLDATNIVDPLLSIITDISYDHMEWLGNTLGAIAGEKAGILRKGGVFITLPQHPEVNTALGEVAAALDVRGISASDFIPHKDAEGFRNTYSVVWGNKPVEIDSPLSGRYQQRNIALALAAAQQLALSGSYRIEVTHVCEGVKQTKWPGRFEFIAHALQGSDLVLDVGHNPAGAWALRMALSQLPEHSERSLVFGCLRDKPVKELAQILFPLFDEIFLTALDSPRSASIGQMEEAARQTGSSFESFSSPREAFMRMMQRSNPGRLVAVTGSVLLVGEIRAILAREHLISEAVQFA